MDRFGVSGMLRVSLSPYNTMEEAEYFVKCLNENNKEAKIYDKDNESCEMLK